MLREEASRLFVILVQDGGSLDINFLQLIKDHETDRKKLVKKLQKGWKVEHRDQIVKLVVAMGGAVRYYDYEEKVWCQQTVWNGLNKIRGMENGEWKSPGLCEFEDEYLTVA